MNYIEKHQQTLRGLAQPKWKRAPLPVDILEKEVSPAAFLVEGNTPHIQVNPFSNDMNTHMQIGVLESEFVDHLGQSFISHAAAKSQNGFHIVSSRDSKLDFPLQIHYKLLDDAVMSEHNLIEVQPGHSLSVVLKYESSGSENSRHHGKTHIVVGAGSRLDIVRFQNLNTSSEFLDNIHFQVGEGGLVRFYDYQLGGYFKATSCQSDLLGRHSRFEVYNGYLGFSEDKLDLSFVAKHYGAHSESKILGKGALGGSARKTFRGTLDFKSGSKSSVGQEEEFVLLLSPDVNADSIPALMCEEDDVIGEHAASVGRMDSDLLFYMMSRGFSEEEARRTLIQAAIADTLESLDLQEIKEEILGAFESRLLESRAAILHPAKQTSTTHS